MRRRPSEEKWLLQSGIPAVTTFLPDKFIDGGVESHCVVNKIDYYWQIFPSDHEMVSTVDLGEVKKLLARAGLESDRS